MKFEINNNTLKLSIEGKIDTSNAAEIENEIFEILKNNQFEKLVLDAEKLDYISSAGLRVILKIKKEYDSFKIINCKAEVYEIFDMTGFNEMIDIEKAFREFKVDGCEVIGEGQNGKVYRINPDTIIKVYLNPDSLEDIKRETALARRAFVLGIPTAIPYDVVRVGNSYGSVFEMLEAKSFAKLLNDDAQNYEKYACLYVDLLKKIHSTKVKEDDIMPSIKEKFISWVDMVKEYFEPAEYNRLRELVSNIKETNTMLHGDYHVKNTLMQNGEVLLIDMDTLSKGHPIFELSQMYNAYVGHYISNSNVSFTFLGLPYDMSEKFWNKVFDYYFKDKSEFEKKIILKKIELLSAIRIMKHTIRRDDLKDPEIVKKMDANIKRAKELLSVVDSLDF